MYILLNAMQNIFRNRGRNILMGVILLAIIVTTAVSLIINNTSSGIIDNYKARFGSEVTISLDREKLMSLAQDGTMPAQINPKQYLSFADSQYLQKVQFSSQMMAVPGSDTLHVVDEDAQNSSGNRMMLKSNGSENAVAPTMKLIGVQEVMSLPEFKDGQRSITEGRVFQSDTECIVSQDFATLNKLKTGDVISIGSAADSTETPSKLTVVGIYSDVTNEYGNMPVKNPFMNRRNEVLTTIGAVTGTDNTKSAGRNMQGTFYLKNPKDLAAFDAELRAKGLPDIYNVSTDEESYNKIVAPVEGLKSVILTFIIVVLVLGAVILVLLSVISMRERKYEVGVLRAMGMGKSKVALGFLSETLVITAICLIVGLSAGIATAQPVSNALLKNQVEIANKNNTPANNGGFFLVAGGKNLMGQSDAKPLDKMDVSLDMATIGEIILISLLLAGVASVIGISYITRYEPMTILTERN